MGFTSLNPSYGLISPEPQTTSSPARNLLEIVGDRIDVHVRAVVDKVAVELGDTFEKRRGRTALRHEPVVQLDDDQRRPLDPFGVGGKQITLSALDIDLHEVGEGTPLVFLVNVVHREARHCFRRVLAAIGRFRAVSPMSVARIDDACAARRRRQRAVDRFDVEAFYVLGQQLEIALIRLNGHHVGFWLTCHEIDGRGPDIGARVDDERPSPVRLLTLHERTQLFEPRQMSQVVLPTREDVSDDILIARLLAKKELAGRVCDRDVDRRIGVNHDPTDRFKCNVSKPDAHPFVFCSPHRGRWTMIVAFQVNRANISNCPTHRMG